MLTYYAYNMTFNTIFKINHKSYIYPQGQLPQ
jgi:hypothetical protein